jgi:hypothetical protein
MNWYRFLGVAAFAVCVLSVVLVVYHMLYGAK